MEASSGSVMAAHGKNYNMVEDLNLVSNWLARQDTDIDTSRSSIVVLAGNAVLPVIEHAFHQARELQALLLITGGVGHSTGWLYQAVQQSSRYQHIHTGGRTEASVIGEMAATVAGLPPEQILLECEATNCGENVDFSWRLMQLRGLAPQQLVVVQDPTMQRRTMATFARLKNQVSILPDCVSSPGFVPRLTGQCEDIAFENEATGLWPVNRFIELVMGELPRLYDDNNGYGPAGKGFIAHVPLPEEIMLAWQRLSACEPLRGMLAARKLA
ncbi:hypothetical protein DT73_19335 [Mangrovibacter sp. MFB070]|nr:hypothetical protein DT73_19335 [Mangrovibacter sp. MFB070]